MNRYCLKQLLLTLVLGAAAVCVRCSGEMSTDRSSNGDSLRLPDSDVREATIHLYDRGVVTTEILADRMIVFEAIDSTVAYHVGVDVFDSTGRLTSELVGDSGIIHEETGRLQMYGHVVLINEDQSRLETDYLFWDSRTERIRTPAFVTIITKTADTLRGWGLEADQKLNSFKILREVSGRISNPRRLSEEP